MEAKVKMTPWRITVHCSATPNGKEYSLSNIRRDHLKRGFSDVGYHGVIQPDGEWERGRGLNEKGAGVEGDNDGNIHICLVGETLYTKEQFKTLRYRLDSIFMVYSIKPWDLYCHYQFRSAIKQGKTCPNIPINQLLIWYHLDDEKAVEPFTLYRPLL